MDDVRGLWTVREMAREYGLPLPVAYWLVTSGIIPLAYQVGRAYLVEPEVARRRLEELGVTARDTTVYPRQGAGQEEE